MNFYIVVEGARTEQTVFASWIPHLNRTLTQVSLPGQLIRDNFVILSGHGYPQYLKIVQRAAIDITRNPHYGQLVVSVDAEDDNATDVRNKIIAEVHGVNATLHPAVIVQDACIESWFLGNRRVIRRLPQNLKARNWKAFYDVWANCPEKMPANTVQQLNRAQTAFAYLVDALLDRGTHLHYSKRNPNLVCSTIYLDQLRDRVAATGHLSSFQQFVRAF